MKMKNAYALASIFAAMSGVSFANEMGFGRQNHTVKTQPKKPKQIIIHKGHKAFNYGEKTLYALNQKNADKKAKKLGYI